MNEGSTYIATGTNDLMYDQYGLDIVSLVQFLYEKVIGGNWQDFLLKLESFWNIYSVIALILSLLFFIGFVYAKIRYGELAEIQQDILREEERKWVELYGERTPTQGRWAEIQKHIHDDNPNSWKIAIIEADIFLEEILNSAGYVGVTIGDKLKTANPSAFTTVQDAWNAHKVRNDIAHASGDIVLTRRLAQETLVQYERVFREFGAI